MSKKRTLYAVLIGINDYPSSPLNGCVNDIVAVNDYFQKLCAAQDGNMSWNPEFLLAPHEEESKELLKKGIKYERPSRLNVIQAFEHFKNTREGDFCLLYYSGHGTFITTDKLPLFEDYEPSGELQALACLGEKEDSKEIHLLLDKELGYLVSNVLEGKNISSETDKEGVHFLSLMDCCHSGTNMRDFLISRMYPSKNKEIVAPDVPLGFTTKGNSFYKAFQTGQTKVQPGGIINARHVSIAAAQSSESAYEMPMSQEKRNSRHGIFTYSLLRTLEKSGTNISYAELVARLRMQVRSSVKNQVPILDAMHNNDSELYFLRNQVATPERTFPIVYRKRGDKKWIVGAGAIQGIIPSNSSEKTLLKLTDGSNRLIEVTKVGPSESVLKGDLFTEEDKANPILKAKILEMAFPFKYLGLGGNLSDEQRELIKNALKKKDAPHLKLAKEGETYDLEIQSAKGGLGFVLVRIDDDEKVGQAIFQKHDNASIFLCDVEKVVRYETVLQMSNPNSTISREDFKVEVQVLEGTPFSADTLNDIPESEYTLLKTNPGRVEVKIQEADGDSFIPAAIKVKLTCINPHLKTYWLGALYCDAQFGISDKLLPVQTIGKYQSDFVQLEYSVQAENGGIQKWQALPLMIRQEWRDLGVNEIEDCIIFFISDDKQPFNLEQYNQEHIELNAHRSLGFFNQSKIPQEPSWRTIKIPVKISI